MCGFFARFFILRALERGDFSVNSANSENLTNDENDNGNNHGGNAPPKSGFFKKILLVAAGGAIGFLNGLLGSGGGIIAVPLLTALGVPEKKSHATSILIIFSLSLLSVALYLSRGSLTFSSALPYLPGGALGAVAGAWLLRRLPLRWIKLLFGVVVLYSSARLFWPA